jgi:hypothetical protein
MNRTESTALYVLVMFAALAMAAPRWLANSPHLQGLLRAQRQVVAALAMPELPQIATPGVPAMAEHIGSASVCRRTRMRNSVAMSNLVQVKLAMAQARLAQRQAVLRNLQAQRFVFEDANFAVRPVAVKVVVNP